MIQKGVLKSLIFVPALGRNVAGTLPVMKYMGGWKILSNNDEKKISPVCFWVEKASWSRAGVKLGFL